MEAQILKGRKEAIFVKAFHGFLEGIVQGVGMRYFVYKSATRMNLRGFVKLNFCTKIK